MLYATTKLDGQSQVLPPSASSTQVIPRVVSISPDAQLLRRVGPERATGFGMCASVDRRVEWWGGSFGTKNGGALAGQRVVQFKIKRTFNRLFFTAAESTANLYHYEMNDV